MLKEVGWEGFLQGIGGNIEHVYNNGVSNQAIFRIPTATDAGKLGLGKSGALTSASALDVVSLFVNDTLNTGRLTLNGGLRSTATTGGCRSRSSWRRRSARPSSRR